MTSAQKAAQARRNVLRLFWPKYPYTGRIPARKARRARYWNRIMAQHKGIP